MMLINVIAATINCIKSADFIYKKIPMNIYSVHWTFIRVVMLTLLVMYITSQENSFAMHCVCAFNTEQMLIGKVLNIFQDNVTLKILDDVAKL